MTRFTIPAAMAAVVGLLTLDWPPCDQPCTPTPVAVTGDDTGCTWPVEFPKPGSFRGHRPLTGDSPTCTDNTCSLVAVINDDGGDGGGGSGSGDDDSNCKDWERPCDKGDDPSDPRPGCCPTAANDESTEGNGTCEPSDPADGKDCGPDAGSSDSKVACRDTEDPDIGTRASGSSELREGHQATSTVTLACWSEDRPWRGDFGRDDTCYDSTGEARQRWETGPCYDRNGNTIIWWKNYPGDEQPPGCWGDGKPWERGRYHDGTCI